MGKLERLTIGFALLGASASIAVAQSNPETRSVGGVPRAQDADGRSLDPSRSDQPRAARPGVRDSRPDGDPGERDHLGASGGGEGTTGGATIRIVPPTDPVIE